MCYIFTKRYKRWSEETSYSTPILPIKNISANEVYSFEKTLIVFMNTRLVLCNENTHFSSFQCPWLDKITEITHTNSRRYQT